MCPALTAQKWCRSLAAALLQHQHGFATSLGPPKPGPKLALPGVKNIIAVASGKGGVGKSTTAVNIAVALAQHNRQSVGLMDADVYGPSIPRMMHLSGKPVSGPEGKMVPPESHGVRCMSMGLLMQEDAPAVWRGPMVMSALESFMTKVAWAPLDVLVIDMPPGTGDAQLSVSQRLPLSGAVIVSTPQDIALIDARRGVNMFRKVNVPILGIVENMSYYQCPSCGHQDHIFGEAGAKQTAAEMGIELLGEVPLQQRIREQADAGLPIVAKDPGCPSSRIYISIADRIHQLLRGAPPAR
eukprot:jgi/Astpho2/7784/e_gw1.00117.155.1_t